MQQPGDVTVPSGVQQPRDVTVPSGVQQPRDATVPSGVQQPRDATVPSGVQQPTTFAEIFRNSRFVRMGNPVGMKVKGTIIAVSGGNLYVDFGCKFHAVASVPDEKPELYCKGKGVVVQVEDLELTSHFLGGSKDTSLLEAEVILLGLSS